MPARALEAVANVTIALTLLWPVRARIGAVLSAIPRRYALLSVTSVVVLIGAQAAGEGEAVYPLTDFGMYTTSLRKDQHSVVEYVAELSSGREERLRIARLFPTGGMYLRRRVDDRAEAFESVVAGSRDSAASDELDAMLAAVARKRDALHPGDPVRAIRLWRRTVSLREPSDPQPISRRLIHEYRVR